jgi:tRNA(Phe) wybutosine-synthesizing methylase Tyw3
MCRNHFHPINNSKHPFLNQNYVRLFCSLKLERMANHQESLQALEQKIRSLQSQHALFQHTNTFQLLDFQ